MIVKKGKSQVTFIYHPQNVCRQVALAGTFNDWEPARGRMVRRQDGSFRKRCRRSPKIGH